MHRFFLFLAKCNCNSQLSCQLSRPSENDDLLASFTIILGSGKNCGPSYLRAAEREKACDEMNACGSVDQYRAKVAKEVMRSGGEKPPIVYSSNVLHVARSECKQKKYLDSNPILALNIMKCTMHANNIHDIGLNPFSVSFWVNEQIHAYKKVYNKYGVTMCVDSTGLKIQPIKWPLSNLEASIFLDVIW